MVTLSRSLLYLKEAIVHIQGVGQDIVSGAHSVMECCRELKGVRNDVDGFSNCIFQHSSRIAEISGISVSMPRVSGCQYHRSNPEFTSVEEYFKKTAVIPFLDISSQFSEHSLRVASLQNLVPCSEDVQ